MVDQNELDVILVDAWELFGNTPINDNDEIEEEFSVRVPICYLYYPVGTDRFEIWHDFDDLHSKGVAHLMEVG